MPPEQAAGRMRDVDARSDIYSLGATLYYVLTRQEPHRGDDPMDVIVKVLHRDPPRPREVAPDLPEAVEAIILKAMARVKEARYATAGEMADDLEKLLTLGSGAIAAPRRSRTPLMFAVVAVALAAVVWGVVFFRPPVETPAPLQKPSPLPAFLARLRELKDAKKWRGARALVDKEGGFLPDGDRTATAREIEEDCREWLNRTTAAFCSDVVMGNLEAPAPERFATLAATLPPPEDVILPHAAYDWTRAILPLLDDGRSGPLLKAAGLAIALDDAGENPWFRVAELAGHRALLREIGEQTKRARGATLAVVQECKSAATKLAEPWDALLRGMPPAFRSRHAAQLDKHDEAVRGARKDFPEESPLLQEINFGAILNSPNAERLLEELERKLRDLDAGNLPRESQRALLLHRVTARALAGAFRGTAPAQTAAGLQELAAALKEQGVTAEERSRFGPKVAAVFDRLLR
jgi:hypothetical protein